MHTNEYTLMSVFVLSILHILFEFCVTKLFELHLTYYLSN